jgi:tripartite-type tricarboxylate transporter receptor subunit TctC
MVRHAEESKVSTRSNCSLLVGFLVLVFAAGGACAQAYPSKPVRLVLPFPPGGGTDVVGRLLAQKLGPPVIVDNRAGAGGRIGTELVARSAPDGYTLMLGTSSVMGTGPALYQKLPFNMPKDFAPISLVAYTAYVLAVHPSVPATSVKGLIALAKSRPGRLTFASSGAGGAAHLSGELFSSMAGVKMIHVAYKGSSPGTLSVISGETDLMFSNALPVLPQVKSGRLRALGVTTPQRTVLLPAVPTIAESGLPGFEVQQLYGVLAPAGTPREIVRRLNEEIAKVMLTDDSRSRLLADGSEVRVSTPEELEKAITAEIAKWAQVIRQAGIKEE